MSRLILYRNDGNEKAAGKSAKLKSQLISLLLDKNANVNSQDRYDDTALMWAALNGNIKIVEQLLDKNANVNIQNQNIDRRKASKNYCVRFGNSQPMIQPKSYCVDNDPNILDR